MAVNHTERLSAVEVDVHHLNNTVVTLSQEVRDGFDSIRRALTAGRQPFTAFAGWAAVILSLVYAYGAPLAVKDTRHQTRLDEINARELERAYAEGAMAENFNERIAAIERTLFSEQREGLDKPRFKRPD